MPDLATTGSAVKVVRWLVETGQSITRGQPLLEVETDKAAMEVESIMTGKVKTLSARPGDEIVTGDVIAIVETESSAAPAPIARAEAEQPALPVTSQPPAGPKRAGGMFAKNREAAHPAVHQKQSIPLSSAQRTVARRIQESKQTVPHFYLQTSVNAEPMIGRRSASTAGKIVWDAFFVYAVGKALKKFDRMCFQFETDHLVHTDVDGVGVAVSQDDELYVITISSPASKTPEQISDEIRAKVEALRSSDPEAKKLRPANATITNLGASSVTTFAAIINPPESSILAVGKVAPVVVVQEGKIVSQRRVSLTLSVDHRVVNGKYAADYLGAISEALESF